MNNDDKELTDVDGGGMMIYLERSTCGELDLDDESKVSVSKYVEDGDLRIEITASSQGVGVDDLRMFANKSSTWNATDYYEDEEEMYLSIRNHNEIRVSIDDNYSIDGVLVNNITIETPSIDITDNTQSYQSIVSLCEGTPVDVRLTDTKGLWERVERDQNNDVEDMVQVLDQISNQAKVSAVFFFSDNSTQIDMDTIRDVVEIEEELHDKAISICEEENSS